MRRSRAAWIPATLFVGVTAAHLLMTAAMTAPIVQPDELGYLDNARHLALGGPRPVTGYYPGLSVLLTPVWRFTRDPIAVWHTALAINSVLCGLTTLAAWWLIPRLASGPVSTRRRVVVTLAVSAYPAIALYSNVSMAESLFEVAAGLVVLLAVRAAEGDSRWWMALGLAAGLLVAIHPRGLAVGIATVVVGAVALRPRNPRAWARMIGLAAGVVTGWALCRVLLVAVRPPAGTGLGTYQASAVLDRATAHGAPRLLLLGTVGQIWYLTIATAGLAPVGVGVGLAAFVRMARRRVSPSPAVIGQAVAALSMLGILGMSVLFLDGGRRADHLLYGRYNEGAVVAVLVVATTWILTVNAVRRCVVWIAAGGGVIGVGTVALAIGLTHGQRTAVLNPSTVLALDAVLRLTGPGLQLAAIGLIGAAVVGLAVVISWRAPAVALAVIAALFVWAGRDTYATYLRPGSSARADQNVLATTVARSTSQLGVHPSCVGYDAGLEFPYFTARFYLPEWRIVPINGTSGSNPCPFVISSRSNFFSFHPGSQIVNVENDLPMILYVMPGSVLKRLRAAGWLLPAVIPGPLNITSQRAKVVTPPHAPRTLRVGGSSCVKIKAVNAGRSGNNAWPNLYGFGSPKYAVRATARWFRAGTLPTAPGEPGAVPLATTVVELPRPVLPSESVTLTIPLNPRRLGPGRYTVLVALYQELVGTIPGGVLSIPVTITG